MNEQTTTKYLIFAGLGLVALVVLGVMGYLVGSIFDGEAAEQPEMTFVEPTATPLPPPVITIQGIKSQAELSTVEMTTVAEIYNESLPEGWLDEFLGTKEKLLILAYGEVRAGFNLEEMNEESLWTDGKKVRLVLPAPKVLNSSINFDRTRIVYYENNIILDDNNPNLQGEALAKAKESIEKSALEAGILNQANDFGKLYFENFLYSLGFTDVEVVVDAQIFKE
jgi:hypothetical protein